MVLISMVSAVFLAGCGQKDFDELTTGRFSCSSLDPAPTFCDDFDSETSTDTWNRLEVLPSGSGSVVVDSDAALSRPNSLLASVTGADRGVYLRAAALKTFATYENTPIHVRISFDMMVEQIDPRMNARVIAFQFLFGDLQGYNQLVLNLESTGTEVNSQFSEALGPDPGTRVGDTKSVPNLNEWSHVEFELQVFNPQGSGNNATLSIDSVELFKQALSYDLRAGVPRMELGIPWVDTNQAAEAWQIRYDNVRVDIGQL